MALPINANIKLLNPNAIRLDRFDGTNYMRWKDKMTFLLTTLKVSYVLDPKLQLVQAPKENDSEAVKNARLRREEDELICRRHILNSFTDRLLICIATCLLLKKFGLLWKRYTSMKRKFQTHLQIEAENRSRDAILAPLKVNYVSQNSAKPFQNKLKPFKKNSAFKKSQPCYHCGKKGHFIKYCKFRNSARNFGSGTSAETSSKANLIEHELVAMVSDMQVGMVTKLNMANPTKSMDWWLDSGAIVHVCNNKAQFKFYEDLKEPEEVLMGNNVTIKVLGKGTVELRGLRVVLESNKVIISKNGNFVGERLFL
ncbi:hypothetical protein SLEP1_g22932 [Rubroshorea leprosula]|uniref:CCHC-type domain-containing protein n=1 Tax=Rubroshorea leprosula TaxID=152421 RepID=A0AAV5JAW6_9ROSI|nr:hypothetical protein SLEP1_g22932 [Rubroshorea leprosula]